MHTIFFLVLRRMRQPLLTLIIVYAIVLLGLVLIPGQDADGNPWRMDFFHAFYFLSFMSTTIGFGEIPYAFTDGQRLWVTISIYITVIAWLYAIGTLLTLVQDRVFQEAIAESKFARRIRQLKEPFHLICGYGETGQTLVRALTNRHRHAVVVDGDAQRISLLQLQNLREFVPALHGDAQRPEHLIEAGLNHPCCAGVVALTDDNKTNLKVAITSKLLNPDLKVICRADSHDIEANMASFGTDHIIDPFDTFAAHLATALQSPGLYLLRQWLSEAEESPLTEPIYPPTNGHWIICGYGRMGKAVCQRLRKEGIAYRVVEAQPEATGRPPEGVVIGRGTEADTLLEAGVDSAVGLVAGTDDDANNLSIVMTAQAINPRLFVIARQNLDQNSELFDAVHADMVMHPGSIVAEKIRVLLATPMLYEFINLAQYQDDEWACEQISRIIALVKNRVPAIMEVAIDDEHAYAVSRALAAGEVVSVADLLRDSWQIEHGLDAMVLLLRRGKDRYLMPAPEMTLKADDRLLLCGNESAFARLSWSLSNVHTLSYLLTGEAGPQGWVWRKWRQWRGQTPRGIGWS